MYLYVLMQDGFVLKNEVDLYPVFQCGVEPRNLIILVWDDSAWATRVSCIGLCKSQGSSRVRSRIALWLTSLVRTAYLLWILRETWSFAELYKSKSRKRSIEGNKIMAEEKFCFNWHFLFYLTATAGMNMYLNWFYLRLVWLDMWTSNLFWTQTSPTFLRFKWHCWKTKLQA